MKYFSGYLTNKASIKIEYILQLGEGELSVMSFATGSVKTILTLKNIHAILLAK